MSPRPNGTPDPDACDTVVVTNSHSVDVQWGTRRDADFPADSQLARWAVAVLDCLDGAPADVCVRMMDAAEIAGLNLRYRGKEGPTNVLSFPGSAEDEHGRRMLGDLALCTEIIRREAVAQGKSLDAHTAHMLVHGILHLSGYDHEDDREAREMEQVETEILEQFGFADPYGEQAGQGDNDHE